LKFNFSNPGQQEKGCVSVARKIIIDWFLPIMHENNRKLIECAGLNIIVAVEGITA
jgi:hypothetical protein